MNAQELAAGIRTVKQVADYFAELKVQAAALVERIGAQQRGYFLPEEEEDTQALLVSYWKMRSALFDVVCTMRREGGDLLQPDPGCFVVAFSAASLLVDAARFLREIADAKPVVRDKLNEPAPPFGIPAGVYDAVQRSLLSARHGWHLLHARQYYQTHRDALREVAAAHDAEELTGWIEQYDRRLDVTVTQFTRAKLRTRANQIARHAAESLLGRALYGLQKLAGLLASDRYVRPGHVPSLPAGVRAEVLRLLQPGDVLVVRKEYALTNYFLPGFWPHAALFLGTREQLIAMDIAEQLHVRPRWDRLMGLAQSEAGVVLESMKDGVHFRPLRSPFGVDSIVVLRPRLSAELVARGIARGLAHEGKPYDFDFDFRRADRLVCTEVVYRALEGIGPMQLPLTRRVGRLNLSGGDLLRLTLEGKQFSAVAAYAPQLTPSVLHDRDCLPLIATAERQDPALASDSPSAGRC
ncbi:MAG: YiiX/YebB-like N1pC/P60 family cysteine hydrolase [Pirellulaceae bacterium]